MVISDAGPGFPDERAGRILDCLVSDLDVATMGVEDEEHMKVPWPRVPSAIVRGHRLVKAG